MTDVSDTASHSLAPPIALSFTDGFPGLLDALGGSIAFSTYQAGKFLLVGLAQDGQVRGTELAFPRSMGIGLSSDLRQMYLATQHQIYRFDNFLSPSERREDGTDAIFVPRVSWVTGDLDAHDIAPGPGGRPVFVNTAFNCLAQVRAGFSFRSIWRPPFISTTVYEDRCHLNGMATENDAPRYVSLCAQSDRPRGWREARVEGGLVMDVRTNDVVCRGLSMPHSPRLYRGRLWILNSGCGEFGWIDLDAGTFKPIAFCPGYARGLAFAGGHALIGLSGPRDDRLFEGLPLQEKLHALGISASCSVVVVNLTSGKVVGSLSLPESIRELYDVQFLPGIRNPTAIGFRTEEIRRMIAIG